MIRNLFFIIFIFFCSGPLFAISAPIFDTSEVVNNADGNGRFNSQNTPRKFDWFSNEFEPLLPYYAGVEKSRDIFLPPEADSTDPYNEVIRRDDNLGRDNVAPIADQGKSADPLVKETVILLLIGSGLLAIVKIGKKFTGNALDHKFFIDQEMMDSEDMKSCEYFIQKEAGKRGN